MSELNELRFRELRVTGVIYFPFVLTLVLASGFILIHRLVAKDKSMGRLLLRGSFFFYALNVIRLVFFPLPINREYMMLVRQFIDAGVISESRNNFELFDFMKWGNLFYWTTVGNFFLLFPLGIYLPLFYKKHRWNVFKVVGTAFLVSLTIELSQLGYSHFVGYTYRSFDVDDLLMNTLGAFTAYLIFGLGNLIYWIGRKCHEYFS
ncbi:MAG: VanZ family protein [Turicibacter sp.]|nr:VanZ family protein [Turicibacter sp.]